MKERSLGLLARREEVLRRRKTVTIFPDSFPEGINEIAERRMGPVIGPLRPKTTARVVVLRVRTFSILENIKQ
jgi:hypothetical protein